MIKRLAKQDGLDEWQAGLCIWYGFVTVLALVLAPLVLWRASAAAPWVLHQAFLVAGILLGVSLLHYTIGQGVKAQRRWAKTATTVYLLVLVPLVVLLKVAALLGVGRGIG